MLVSEILEMLAEETILNTTLIKTSAGNLSIESVDIYNIELEEIVVPKTQIRELIDLVAKGDIVGSTEIKIGTCDKAMDTEFIAANEKELIIKEM